MKHHEQASPLPVPLEDREELVKVLKNLQSIQAEYSYLNKTTDIISIETDKAIDTILKAGYKKG